MAIRVISSDERQSRRAQTSVARRVTRRFRPTKKKARRARHCVTAAATHYAIGPRPRNAACVTFTTGCYAYITDFEGQTQTCLAQSEPN